jgi:prophage DNA circulation protein
MSWRDRLSPASFRGVEFFVESVTMKPSRRTVVHEFPAREDVIVDDLGRGPDRFEIKAYVIGPDYDQQRDALEGALLTPGAGTLVHPTRGRMSVAVEGEPQIEESPKTRGGMATISFSVVKVVPGTLAATPATGAQLTSAANIVSEATGANFIAEFDTTGMPSSFIESATARVTEAAEKLAEARAAISGALAIADAVTGALEDFTDGVETLVTDPTALLGDFQDLAEDILRAGVRAQEATLALSRATQDAVNIIPNRRATRQTLAASAMMQSLGADDSPIDTTAPLSERESENRKALTNMLRSTSIAAVARAAVAMPFTSLQEAQAASAQLLAEIEDISEDIDDDTYIALRNLSVAISAHLARVASELPETRTHVVIDDTSSIMLAHWLYGDASRADEIVARNAIKNPGLISRGTELEVTVS